MRQRNDRRTVELVAAADAGGEPVQTEQPPDRQAADRDDQLRPQDLELPRPPEPAQLLLAWRRRAVAAARCRAAGVAARHRRAIERRIELLFLELQPTPQGLARAPAPRTSLVSLDDARRLPVHVGALTCVHVADRPRLERVARLDAGAADAE